MSSQKDIHLYTASTMNGWKPVVFLEEAGVEYDLTHIDFSKNEQKAPDYVKLNPSNPYVRHVAIPKVEKLFSKHGELIKGKQ